MCSFLQKTQSFELMFLIEIKHHVVDLNVNAKKWTHIILTFPSMVSI